MQKITGEKAEKIVELAKASNLQPSTQLYDDDACHMEATVTLDGKTYRVTTRISKADMDAIEGALDMIDWDRLAYTVEAYEEE